MAERYGITSISELLSDYQMYDDIEPFSDSAADRCVSPNEHVELIRELESRYAEMLKPIRDLNKNFAVSLDVLEKYIHEVKQISIDTINFANAGLILQSSKEVYARKVDYLEKLFEDLQKTAYNVKRTEKDNDENPDDNPKSKRAKKRKAMADGLDEYKLISPDDIPQLSDGAEVNFNNVGLTYITQLRACLLKPEVSVHVELRDVNGDLIGRKNDFRVNWPINQDGMPCDLTLCYYEERSKNPPSDPICDELSDRDDDCLGTPPRNSPAESMFGHPEITSTPAIAQSDKTENDTGVMGEPDQKSKRKLRAKKLPSEMTLDEFLHGKKRKSRKTTANNKKEKRTRRKERSAKELEEQLARAAATVEEVVAMSRLCEEEVKAEDGASLDKLAEASSVTPVSHDAFSPPEGKPDDLLEKRLSPTTPQNNGDRMAGTPEIKDDIDCSNSAEGRLQDNVESEPQDLAGSSCHDNPERQSLSRPASSCGSAPDFAMDAATSDDDLDVPRRGDASTATDPDPTSATIIEDGQIYKTGLLELDPMNQRIRQWEDRIMPILEEQAARPKFRLPEYANKLLGEMPDSGVVPCTRLIASDRQYEVSRNFVALLHLCNTRNVEMANGNITLLSREYRLSAEDVESYE